MIIANKADLLPVCPKDDRVLFISSHAQNPKSEREKLLQAILKKRPHIRPLRILVVGFPNTGKSSVINLLASRHAARTGEKAGVTTNVQWIRIGPEVLLVDTPGVFPDTEEKAALVARGAVNVDGLQDKEGVACQLISQILGHQERKPWLAKFFDIELPDGCDANFRARSRGQAPRLAQQGRRTKDRRSRQSHPARPLHRRALPGKRAGAITTLLQATGTDATGKKDKEAVSRELFLWLLAQNLNPRPKNSKPVPKNLVLRTTKLKRSLLTIRPRIFTTACSPAAWTPCATFFPYSNNAPVN